MYGNIIKLMIAKRPSFLQESIRGDVLKDQYLISELDIYHHWGKVPSDSDLYSYQVKQCMARTNSETGELDCNGNKSPFIRTICSQPLKNPYINTHIARCSYVVQHAGSHLRDAVDMSIQLHNNSIINAALQCSRHSIAFNHTCYVVVNQSELNSESRPTYAPHSVYMLFMSHAACVLPNTDQIPCEVFMSLAESQPAVITGTDLCGQTQFQCHDNHCISDSLVLDGKPDCLDGSDEGDGILSCWDSDQLTNNCSKCQTPACWCSAQYFQCLSGGCLLWSKVCNGVDDCPRSTDEIECDYAVVPESVMQYFTCDKSGTTIPQTLVADLIADCPDMEDEMLPYQITNPLHTCESPDNIPCVPGHPRCFPFYYLCLYDRDSQGMLRQAIFIHSKVNSTSIHAVI